MWKVAVLVCALSALAVIDAASHNGGHANLYRLNERLEAKERPLYAGPPILTSYFTQKLDHFNPNERRTYQQRYHQNSAYYQPGGPIFIYIGGEGELTNGSIASGEIVNFAQQHNGMLLALEHRYYGMSQPFANLSTPNLRWLSSRQALEDLATFIVNMTAVNNWQNNTWFNVGGSYPGALSAWFRLKYPHLTSGALASSAPVFAKADFYEYDQIVSQSAGAQCSQAIRDATQAVQSALENMTDPTSLKAKFTCQNVADNVGFLYVLADAVSYAIQYTTNTPTSARYHLLNLLCDTMVNSTQSEIDRFANFTITLFNRLDSTCDTFSTTLNLLQNLSTDPSMNQRQWYYQSCTEFGFFQTAPAVGSLRSSWINLTYHLNLCNQSFGMPLVPDCDGTNRLYGGANPEGSQVFFANGGIDPWHALSVLSPLPCCDSIYTQVIAGASHCADLHAPDPSDPAALTSARQEIATFVSRALLGLGPEKNNSSSWKDDLPLWIAVAFEAFFVLAFLIMFWRPRKTASSYSSGDSQGDVAVYQPIGDD